jgi:flavin-binding protein dodecin
MAVARVVELSAASPSGFEEAIQQGVAHANKTLQNVQGIWVKEQKAVVVDGTITEYRVDMKITYLAEE